MPDPEALDRIQIDRLLTEAGWLVVDRDLANIFTGGGVVGAPDPGRSREGRESVAMSGRSSR